MTLPAIKVTAISKLYRIGAHRHQRKMLREVLSDVITTPFKRSTAASRAAMDAETEMWALKDVTFEIRAGEVVGIIGRNGAGKSTLLKILTQITAPTKGQVEIRGRVASLLEVGTGFHPELTGRENIFLNGAILGMKRAEIIRKFDEIVAFAEVDKFIDTPVKHYSSGMYVRLAFAVAAHMEPEILLVDEVLAVGDIQFQKKCLGKMNEVAANKGRTVLFVSHNMSAIQSLCTRGILLEGGRLVFDGDSSLCVEKYSENGGVASSASWIRSAAAPRSPLEIRSVQAQLRGRQPKYELIISMDLKSVGPHAPAFLCVDILDNTETALMQALPRIEPFIMSGTSDHHLEVKIQLPPMIPGDYFITVWVGSHNTRTLDEAKRCAGFHVEVSPTEGRSFPHYANHGRIVPPSSVDYR